MAGRVQMAELKLAKLPDRTPVKFTITLSPDLAKALGDYAAEYERQYGARESISELIPFMLAAFIEGDTGFRKAKRHREEPVRAPGQAIGGRAQPSGGSSTPP